MELKDTNFNNVVKVKCNVCEGSGLHKVECSRIDIGTVCTSCVGRGYHIIKLSNSLRVFQDQTNKNAYLVENDRIINYIDLFNQLVIRDDIKYVIFDVNRTILTNNVVEIDLTSENIVKYKDFINGSLPLPINSFTCPKQFCSLVNADTYFEECDYMWCFTSCPKYKTDECWKKYYKHATDVEQKQKIIRKHI